MASRREAERLIVAGSVRVNGEAVTNPGTKIDPATDRVEVDGKPVSLPEEAVYLMLHKPAGYTCTRRGFRGEKNIFRLIPDHPGLHYVGRLDKDSSGLLILTNDGDLTMRLTHPRYGGEKEYEVSTSRPVSRSEIGALLGGVDIGEHGADENVRAVAIRPLGANRISMVITQGRKRQIRRMLAVVGHDVEELKRVRVKTLRLGTLPPGDWRRLSEEEVRRLLE